MRFSVRFTPLVVFLLTFSVVAEPASAQYFGQQQVQYQQFNFREFDTDNFTIHYYPEEREAVQDVARMSERWYSRHSQTFLRQFTERKPLIFYANDTDFQQTNVVEGQIGQGVGGVTESLKERVTMPLTGSYQETDRILGHELVHSFQYDIGLRNADRGFSLRRLPLWLVEGMAEYLAIGRQDPQTAMWLRDAALREDLPTTDQLTQDQSYFPYRYGQAYMAYVGGNYGDPAVTNLFKLSGRVGIDSAFVYATGITADSLSSEWQQAVRETYLPLMEGRSHPTETGRMVLGDPDYETREMNVSPAISPDGQYIAFMSQRDIFTINLFIADAETGEVLQELRGTRRDPHFDALRFIDSAGSWSPDGRRFAFITYVEGRNEIAILNAETGRVQQRKRVEGVGAIRNPAWSPDGRQIAFSGIQGGLSDLYVLTIDTDEVRQLTNDRYTAFHPSWSPDGQQLVFTTDRGENGTDFDNLQYGNYRLGLVDVETGDITSFRPIDRDFSYYNPSFGPDGNSIYFISDYEGFQDVFRYAMDEETTYRVTNTQTGVSGISNLAPALSVAQQSGRISFSVFQHGGYGIMTMEPAEAQGTEIEPIEEGSFATAGILPPVRAIDEGLVANYLQDPVTGLPEQRTWESQPHSSRLSLDYIAPPQIGVGVSSGGLQGTQAGLAGGVGFFFSDMLGHRNLSIAAQAQGTFKDIGGQVTYVDRERRLNLGATASHIPYLFGSVRQVALGQQPGFLILRNRQFNTQAAGVASYPFSQTRRLDLTVGATRVGFDVEAEFYPLTGGTPQRVDDQIQTPDPLYIAEANLAYVGDYSFFGFTSPIQGGRHRFSVTPRLGSMNYTQALADYREYFFFSPITFAVRGLHIGNYMVSDVDPAEDEFGFQRQFTELYMGDPYQLGFLRGYSFASLDECQTRQGTCPEAERLFGTRLALASAEFRLPLLGTEQFGLINFPYLPTELTVFTDAGIAWRSGEPPVFAFETDPEALLETGQDGSVSRYPMVSVGTSARFNLLGALVFEVFYAYPFQRPDAGGHFGLQLVPGW